MIIPPQISKEEWDKLYRGDEERFREFARHWYKTRYPWDEPALDWHPFVYDELRKLDAQNRDK